MKKETKEQFKKRMLEQLEEEIEHMEFNEGVWADEEYSHEAGQLKAWKWFRDWIKADLGDV